MVQNVIPDGIMGYSCQTGTLWFQNHRFIITSSLSLYSSNPSSAGEVKRDLGVLHAILPYL